jgi:hypothetical protein
MKKQQEKSHHYLLAIIGIIFIFLLYLIILKQNAQYNALQIPSKNPEVTTINPTIIPSSEARWETYIYDYPPKRFSFDFPEDWQVETKTTTKDFPTILLTYTEDSKDYTLSFNENTIKEYRTPDITSKDEIKKYGERPMNVKTIYKNSIPLEMALYFDDFDKNKDAIQMINMELPPTNTENYQLILDKILSSLKFY